MNKDFKPTLVDVVTSIDKGLDELIRKVSGLNAGKIVIGYNQLVYRSIVRMIKTHLAELNELVKVYQQLLPDRAMSEGVLTELFSMDLGNPGSVDLELKKKYMKFHEIHIPNFPFRMEKLIEVYDYPQEHERLISEVLEAATKFNSSKPKHQVWTPDYWGDYWSHYNQKSGEFDLSEADEKDLLEYFTVYASEKDLAEVISLHLLSRSLTALSPAYSLGDLPEIDFRLIPLLKISDDAVSVNLERIQQIRGGLQPGHELDIEITNLSAPSVGD